MALAGKLTFNPVTDSIGDFRFTPPRGQALPADGFSLGRKDLYPSPEPEPQPGVQIVIDPSSQRLEPLQPFASHWGDGSHNDRAPELPILTVLMRVGGKCTTDVIWSPVLLLRALSDISRQTISAAGPWLRYKGHLTNISENTCMSASIHFARGRCRG